MIRRNKTFQIRSQHSNHDDRDVVDRSIDNVWVKSSACANIEPSQTA